MMEHGAAILVRHRRLLSVDRLCHFEQVCLLPRPIWLLWITQAAICPVLYTSYSNSPAFVCACVLQRHQVKLLLCNHGCVSSRPLITAAGHQHVTLTPLCSNCALQHTDQCCARVCSGMDDCNCSGGLTGLPWMS